MIYNTNIVLQKPLSNYIRINKIQEAQLKRLQILTVQDLLYHFPYYYNHSTTTMSIVGIEENKPVTIYGSIHSLSLGKTWKTKKAVAKAIVRDANGSISIQWFHQPYVAKMFSEGDLVKVSGNINIYNDKPSMINPVIEKVNKLPEASGSMFKTDKDNESIISPKYRETKGITSLWIYHTAKRLLSHEDFKSIKDPIPEKILKKYNLPTIQTALVWIHAPNKERDAEVARKRFAFEEMFFIQLKLQNERYFAEGAPTYRITDAHKKGYEFIKNLTFELTNSQADVTKDILDDMDSKNPMSRLLEGDVGSGKTVVAAATSYAILKTPPDGREYGSLQVAYMAPTEILAKQHFESFIEFFKEYKLPIALITGKGCYKYPSKTDITKPTKISRAQLSKWVKSGEIGMVIGTHALISKNVEFSNLAYVIIDEQHRFGTRQRKALTSKSARIPHLLSMTATPIPRTLALTIYGDLDISLIDEMPPGRKEPVTKIVPPSRRKDSYKHIQELLDEGQQTYVICPRIFEQDEEQATKLRLASVEETLREMKEKVFPNSRIEALHGKMKPKEKDEVMAKFNSGEIDILVATSVIEVGVNVPNASSIMIFGSERFGLSQLHQLRGRVIRGTHQPYCYLFTDTKTEKSLERLGAIEKTHNGFSLAEKDLKLRGMGDFYGQKQWGISDLAMEALSNIVLVESAQKEAKDIVKSDPGLKKNTLMKEYLEMKESAHLE